MDITNLLKEPHLSVSSIDAYMECGLQYKFSRIDKLTPEFTSDNLIYGSTIHKVLAAFQMDRMIGNDLTLTDLQNDFEKRWQNLEAANVIRYSKDNTHEKLLAEGKQLLKAYYESLPEDSFNIIAIEEPFAFKLEGLDVPIVGYMDLVEEDQDGTIIITDYKTSSKSYSKDAIDNNFQITVYQIAAKANGYADKNILLKLDCLIKTKTPKFEQYYTSRNEIEEDRAIKKIKHVWDGIEKGVFIPNDHSWKCPNYCEYKGYCDDWFKL